MIPTMEEMEYVTEMEVEITAVVVQRGWTKVL
jgi:hypothetical protein